MLTFVETKRERENPRKKQGKRLLRNGHGGSILHGDKVLLHSVVSVN